MRLFHFSEESNIEIFQPRVKENRQDMPPVVWAIEEGMSFSFYCPRNCPRIVYRRGIEVSPEDERRFFGETASDTVIVFESAWYDRLAEAVLYRYELPPASFVLFDATAGYYISGVTVVPSRMDVLSNPLKLLMDMPIDIRFTPNLVPLRDALLESTITRFGIHRFNHAQSGKV